MIDERVSVYAVTGITGRVGGIVAGTLLDAGLPVRAVVRAAEKGRPWAEKGCEVAIASVADADGLAKAFSGVDGVFLEFAFEPEAPVVSINCFICALMLP
jgi:NAD(P)H dehydrogenase (quinone)